MEHGSPDTVAFRLWPPVAIGVPLLAAWLSTERWGDPVGIGTWRTGLGWALVAAFAVWNGWSLWLFARHETGLLPGQATQALIEVGPYRLSRNPLYVGLLALYLGVALLAPTLWGLVLFPVAILLVHWAPYALRSVSCTCASGRRTTTTRAGCVAGSERGPYGSLACAGGRRRIRVEPDLLAGRLGGRLHRRPAGRLRLGCPQPGAVPLPPRADA